MILYKPRQEPPTGEILLTSFLETINTPRLSHPFRSVAAATLIRTIVLFHYSQSFAWVQNDEKEAFCCTDFCNKKWKAADCEIKRMNCPDFLSISLFTLQNSLSTLHPIFNKNHTLHQISFVTPPVLAAPLPQILNSFYKGPSNSKRGPPPATPAAAATNIDLPL